MFDSVAGSQMVRTNVEGWNAGEVTTDVLSTSTLGMVTGTVTAVTNQTTITLSAGVAQNDVYKGWQISFMDHASADLPSCTRIAKAWTSGRVMTLDEACDNFTIATSNKFHLECKTACSRLDVDNW